MNMRVTLAIALVDGSHGCHANLNDLSIARACQLHHLSE